MLQFMKFRGSPLGSVGAGSKFFDEIIDLIFDLLAEMANGRCD